MKTFFQDRENHQPAEPVRKKRAEGQDLPFDVELKRRILGDEPVESDAEATPQEAAATATSTGRALKSYDAWEGLAPLAWSMEDLTRGRFMQDVDVKSGTDALRTRILQKMREEGWTRMAVTGPTAGCGATYTTLNLALSLSAVHDVRTVLLDLNQRTPGIAPALGLKNAPAISLMLEGKLPTTEYLRRTDHNLALGLNGGTSAHAAEALQSRCAAMAFDEIDTVLAPDVVMCDVPPMLEYDDMTAFLPLVDCVLLVADGTRTLGAQIDECAEMLDGRAPLLGVVLNRGRLASR